MSLRQELRALDPAVVSHAIERIANKQSYLSCVALIRAQDGFELYGNVEDNSYVLAYKSTTWVWGMKPVWWNSSEDYSAARIQALEDFRDAIIVAKNPTILERIKGWLSLPCEYANFT